MEQFRTARDSEFYVLVCFQSHDQKDEFLNKANIKAHDGIFVNGIELSRGMSIDLKIEEVSPLPLRGKPNKYTRKEVI